MSARTATLKLFTGRTISNTRSGSEWRRALPALSKLTCVCWHDGLKCTSGRTSTAPTELPSSPVKMHRNLKEMGCTRPILQLPFALPLDKTPPKEPNNVFFHIGAMDWQPNREAVRFLIEKIWPLIRKQRPNAVLRLAGRNMPANFRSENGIRIDGEVCNANSYMRENGILLTPLLSGGGMRIKLIEAMALGRAVVATSVALEGIPAANGVHAAVAETAETFATAAIRMYDDAALRKKTGEAARQLVMENFERRSVTERLLDFYRQV